MFDDANSYACVITEFSFLPDNRSFDCCTHALEWTMRQSYNQAEHRGEFHSSRQPQIQTRGAYVVEQAIKTERVIVVVNAPNSRRKRSCRTRFGPALEVRLWTMQHPLREREMRIENVTSSLLTVHKFKLRRGFWYFDPWIMRLLPLLNNGAICPFIWQDSRVLFPFRLAQFCQINNA